jgi:hypothetical protein
MNTQTKVKQFLRLTGYDLWTLAGKAKINKSKLESLMMTGNDDVQVSIPLDKFLIDNNICPECLMHLFRSSGCVSCMSCGWSQC